VRDALCGPITPACPASAIRLHDRVDVLLDEPAAAALAAAAAPPFQATATEVCDRTSLGLRGPTVVVAPHPDDASISCGGVMSMLDPDAMRHIVTFSTGARAIDGVPAEEARAIREREAEEEADVQGASVSFLRARAYASGSFEPEDARDLVAVLDRCRPARVLLPAREDPHPTHRLCRLTAEDALATHWRGAPRRIELWTFEGPWCLLERGAINLVVRLDPHARERKRAGIRAHRSQVDRVPFDDGAAALERLRAIAFSESHLGGRGCAFDPDSRIECYRRVVLG
jgi:LmbE family N-acetylglucosaminyl deacetylase